MRLAAILSVIFFAAFCANAKADDLLLSWDIPTEREDGTALPLNEINGYRIYHTAPGQAESAINVAGGSTTGYTINGISAGEHILAISTVDSDGVEGNRSAALSVPVAFANPGAPGLTRVIVERCDASGQCVQTTVFEAGQ